MLVCLLSVWFEVGSVSRCRSSSCSSQSWLCGIEEEAEAGKRRKGSVGQVTCLTLLLCGLEAEAEAEASKRRQGSAGQVTCLTGLLCGIEEEAEAEAEAGKRRAGHSFFGFIEINYLIRAGKLSFLTVFFGYIEINYLSTMVWIKFYLISVQSFCSSVRSAVTINSIS